MFHYQDTATGEDANSHAAVATGLFTSNTNTIYKAAALRSFVTLDVSTVREGHEVTVRFTVSNVGSLATKAVTPTIRFDASRLDLGAGPTPASAVLNAPGGGGDVATFEWTLKAKRAGTVSITVSASGEDSVNVGLIRSTASTASVGITQRFEESVACYPNPAPGDTATIGLRLDDDAETVDVDIYNTAMQRVFTGSWRSVSESEGEVMITGLRKWAPGIYLVRTKAKLRNGKSQTLPVVRLVVKR
jgi:hypothetical protein